MISLTVICILILVVPSLLVILYYWIDGIVFRRRAARVFTGLMQMQMETVRQRIIDLPDSKLAQRVREAGSVEEYFRKNGWLP